MAERDEQNRISVDLKLLQNHEMRLLSKFGQDFSKSVDTLNNALRDYTAQTAMYAERAQVRQGPTQSPMWSGTTIANPAAAGYMQLPYHEEIARKRGGGQGGSSTTRPDDHTRSLRTQGRMAGWSFADANLNQYERGNISFGGIGEPTVKDTMRYLSSAIGNFGWDAETGEQIQGRGRNMARRFAGAAGGLSRGIVYGGSAAVTIGGLGRVLAGGSHSQVAPYAQLGYDPTSGMGVFNDATGERIKGAFKSRWNALLNPGWGKQQEDEMRDTLMGLGINPNTNRGGQVLEEMRDAAKHTGLGADTIQQLMKRTVRYGDEGAIKDLGSQIQDLSDKAAQAKMNVNEFTQGIIQLADALTSRTGLSQKSAITAATQFSAATGLSGEIGANLLNNDIYLYGAMAAGGRGTSPLNVSPTDATMQMLTMLPGMLGVGSLEELQSKWASGETDASGFTLKDRFSFLLQSPEGAKMFGGMSTGELGHLLNSKESLTGRMDASKLMNDVVSGSKSISAKKANSVASMLLAGKDLEKFKKETKGDSAQDKMRALQDKFRNDPNKVTLDLTGPAKKLVKQINKDDPVSRNRNDNSSWMGG